MPPQSFVEALRELYALLCGNGEPLQLYAGHCRDDFRRTVITPEYRSGAVIRHVVPTTASP